MTQDGGVLQARGYCPLHEYDCQLKELACVRAHAELVDVARRLGQFWRERARGMLPKTQANMARLGQRGGRRRAA